MENEVDDGSLRDAHLVGRGPGDVAARAEPIDGSTNRRRIEPLQYSSPQGEAGPGSSSANAWRFTIAVCLLLVGAMSLSTLRPPNGGRSAMARIMAAKADIDSLEVALDAYQIDTGQYPSGSGGLQALVQAPMNAANWHGPYVKQIPNDPWGTPYQYKSPGLHNTRTYDLSSAGPDRKVGTKDDLVNWKPNGK